MSLPEPTIRHISIVWPFSGDDDRDSVVTVRYRKSGFSSWKNGMTLRRVNPGSNAGFSWSNAHRGSLFNLQPDTSYDIELTLTDPDGGSTQRVMSATTRGIPTVGNGVVRTANPSNVRNVINASSPGDIVELSSGNYGNITVNQPGQPDGEAGAPITLRGTPGAVINGELGLFGRKHWRLENLTVNGRIRINGSDDMTVVNNRVNASNEYGNVGIANFTFSRRNYIAGNTVIGATPWQESVFAASWGDGIAVTGPGHVIQGNTVSNFRDGISFMEDSQAVDQYSIDVLNNTIMQISDDAIEADFCAHNCRIIGNRITNAFISFSSQPSLGGPTYFIRNQAYNIAHLAFKLYRTSRGDVILHNTIVKHGDGFHSLTNTAITDALVLNNLFLGGPSGNFNGFYSGFGRVVDLVTLEASNSRLDFNGYGTTLPEFKGKIGSQQFASVAEMRDRTSENNGLRVGYDIFAGNVRFPDTPTNQYDPVDFTLEAGSVAVDRGEVIVGINDDYEGAAPDLGALERTSSSGQVLFSDSFE